MPEITTPFLCLAGGEPRTIKRKSPAARAPIAGTGGRPEVAGSQPAIEFLSAKGTLRRVDLDPRFLVPRSVDTVFKAAVPIVEPQPQLELRIRAVYAHDEGTTPPMTLEELRQRVASLVDRANRDMAGTGLRFVFFPRADVEFREDKKLRRDVDLTAKQIADLESGKINEADGKTLLDSLAIAGQTHRNAVAGEQPNKLLWLFSRGNNVNKVKNDDGSFKKWQYVDNRGGSFSGIDNEFVALHEAIVSTLQIAHDDASRSVHETGHYLSLPHTHREPLHDLNSALTADELKGTPAQQLAAWKNHVIDFLTSGQVNLGSGTAADILAAYDSDRGSNVFDTPADPGAGIIALANQAAGNGDDALGPIDSITLNIPFVQDPVVMKPLRDNPMSYFLAETPDAMRFTTDQVAQMRSTLTAGVRRPLVAAQLGDTATPDLRVCGVWSPSNAAQRLTWLRTLADHKAEHQKMQAKGMAMAWQQAYTRNGAVRYDGIWNPGKQAQEVIFGFLDSDVKSDQLERAKRGMRPVRVQGYMHLSDGPRYNAIYEPGSSDAIFFLGITQSELDTAWNDLKKTMRMTCLSVHVDGNGVSRYSTVFRPGNVAQAWVSGWTLDDLAGEYDKRWKAGFKIRDISVVKLAQGHRWTAIFQPDQENQLVYWAHVRERISEVYDEMWASDFKLRAMSVVPA